MERDQVIALLSRLLDNQRPYPKSATDPSWQRERVLGMNQHARRTHSLIVQLAKEAGISEKEITVERGDVIPKWDTPPVTHFNPDTSVRTTNWQQTAPAVPPGTTGTLTAD